MRSNIEVLTGFLRKKTDRAPIRGMSPSRGSITTLIVPWSWTEEKKHQTHKTFSGNVGWYFLHQHPQVRKNVLSVFDVNHHGTWQVNVSSDNQAHSRFVWTQSTDKTQEKQLFFGSYSLCLQDKGMQRHQGLFFVVKQRSRRMILQAAVWLLDF